MMSCFSVGRRGRLSLQSAGAISLAYAGLVLGGCSADVTRFDSASFSLNDPPETASAAPIPSEPVRSGYTDPVVGSTPRGPYGAGASSVEVAALPDPSAPYPPPRYTPPAASAPSYRAPAYRPPSYQAKTFERTRHEPAPSYRQQAALPPTALAKGEMIEVQQGDTLYSISKRHHVSVAELMSVNSLSAPGLKLGQKLYLPGGESAPTRSVASERAVESARPAAVPLAPASPEVAARYNGSYTMRPGDSLYGVARTHGVLFSELQRVNGITDPTKVKPGFVLKVPGEASTPNVASNRPALPTAPPNAASSEPPRYGQATTTQPTVINSERRVASLSDRATDAMPEGQPASQPAQPAVQPAQPREKVAIAAPTGTPNVAESVKLRWPASGKIIAGFGGRPDGTHNDGINVSVPLGTEVHAAEDGVVAYSGSELKGYGNLVLLRHDNGWVTAYAHNDELLVKRGDKVKRGQVIAKAGKTGSVDQPQVHFELRQGSKPVDPVPYLEKL
jgi:murein DD-endopeptidase MepM/ murein hydrolase activator NlpD